MPYETILTTDQCIKLAENYLKHYGVNIPEEDYHCSLMLAEEAQENDCIGVLGNPYNL